MSWSSRGLVESCTNALINGAASFTKKRQTTMYIETTAGFAVKRKIQEKQMQVTEPNARGFERGGGQNVALLYIQNAWK